MNTLLSGLPILAVVVSLLAGISALRAAWLGLAATLLAVVLAFPVAPSSIWPAVVARAAGRCHQTVQLFPFIDPPCRSLPLPPRAFRPSACPGCCCGGIFGRVN